MLRIRRADERFRTRIGWLDSRHTFSFAEHYDPELLGFGALRVINDDRVAAGRGFGAHPHRDMEIISYVLDGALEHRDSLGHGSVIHPGDVQRMSAGTGIVHSEFNPNRDAEVRFLQIWIVPAARGLEPSYEQRHFDEASRRGQWRLVASADGREGSLTVHQDVSLYVSLLEVGEQLRFPASSATSLYLHVARGELSLSVAAAAGAQTSSSNGEPAKNPRRDDAAGPSERIELLVEDAVGPCERIELREGDGVAIDPAESLEILASAETELLLFELARAQTPTLARATNTKGNAQ